MKPEFQETLDFEPPFIGDAVAVEQMLDLSKLDQPQWVDIPLSEIGTYPSPDSQHPDMAMSAEDQREIIKTHSRMKLESPVDYEHAIFNAQRGKADPQAAVARGWGKQIRIVGRKMQALLEFSKEAQDAIRKKEFRYISPVLIWGNRDSAGNVHYRRIHSYSLTNAPYAGQLPLVAGSITPRKEDEHTMPIPEKLQKFLTDLLATAGVTATPEQIEKDEVDYTGVMSAFNSKISPKPAAPAAVMSALGLKDGAGEPEMLAAVLTLKAPASDMVAAAVVETLRAEKDAEIATLKASNADMLASALLTDAFYVQHKVNSEQIKPGSDLHKLAHSDPETFKKTVALLPTIPVMVAAAASKAGDPPPAGDAPPLDDDMTAVAQVCGIRDKNKFAKFLADKREQ